MNPPLWFEIMDPLVDIYQVQKRKPTLAEETHMRSLAQKGVRTAVLQMHVLLLLYLLF